MKKRLYRFVSSRSFASVLSILALAALSFFALDEAYAIPPVLGGGGITNNFKSLNTNQNLVCNFADPRSTVLITFGFSEGPFFEMFTPVSEEGQGVVMCGEVDRLTGKAGPLFAFTLTQVSLDTCHLNVRTNDEDPTVPPGIQRWEFDLNFNACGDLESVNSFFVNPTLEWDLQAVDPSIPICPGGESPCINRIGVPDPGFEQEPFPQTDFPANSLPAGVVFRYDEPLSMFEGVNLPGTLFLRPCHSGSFDPADPIQCKVEFPPDSGNFFATTTQGVVPGMVPPGDPSAVQVMVEIKPESYNVKSQGKLDIRIFNNGTLDLSKTNFLDLEVNGTSMTSASKLTFADINGDGFTDIWAKVDRPAFTNALDCWGNGPTRVNIIGVLQDGTLFTGSDTIGVVQCPR